MTDQAPRSWEEFERLAAERERTHQRLKQVFEVSKLFSKFESVEKTLPAVIESAAKTLPLYSAVLIEYRDDTSRTSIFHSPELSKEHLRKLLIQTQDACSKLLGLSSSQISILESRPPATFPIFAPLIAPVPEQRNQEFIMLPLIVYNLPPFGTFQIECQTQPEEVDLAFIGSLTNLLAVSLERHYVAQSDEELRRRETEARRRELSRSQGQVTELEIERDLRNRFMATLTHDLRTPLTSARMNADLITRDNPKPALCQQLAGSIKNSIDRMDSMIQDLLDMARIRSGEPLPLKIQECDLREIAVSSLQELSSHYGDRLRLEVEKRHPEIHGFWSPDLLRRMIENLVNNAVKYGFPGRPIILTLKASDQEVEFAVRNEGTPLSEEEQAGIFQPFSRTHSAHRSEKKGWGLGLTLVQGAAEAHGGKVRVTSAPGSGTCFIVTLPRDARPAAAR